MLRRIHKPSFTYVLTTMNSRSLSSLSFFFLAFEVNKTKGKKKQLMLPNYQEAQSEDSPVTESLLTIIMG